MDDFCNINEDVEKFLTEYHNVALITPGSMGWDELGDSMTAASKILQAQGYALILAGNPPAGQSYYMTLSCGKI